jgi:asparagine synthase (glutamine-hydrolysing)
VCGIAGQVDWTGVSSDGDVADITHRIRHRGPDDSGLWRSPRDHCVLGHTRLSIIDLSSAGHQPMLDPETGNALVFNGEIYNFQQRRDELIALGDKFHSSCDTEVILALYRRHGIDCLEYLRGMFAFAIWDEGKRRLFIARDRVGKKPFHYAQTPNGIVFSSEIDPLVRHPLVDDAIDPEGLELYTHFQYVPAPWTIYRSIRKLPPAHYGTLDQNGLQLHEYWDVDHTQKLDVDEEQALDLFDEKLREATRLRMIADVPLGALLSGGVDSSVIVALMAQMQEAPINTFSIGFDEGKFNELPYAQQVADQYSTNHRPEVLEPRVELLIGTIARHYGEPFADSSAVPSFYVCQTARRHVTVALVGDGGDELLGGYPKFSIPALGVPLSRWMAKRSLPSALVGLLPSLFESRTIPEKIRRRLLLRYLYPELESFYRSNFFTDRARARLLGHVVDGVPRSSPLVEDFRLDWMEKARDHAQEPIDRMLWMDHHTYLAGDLLPKMDIASMHCSLEARSPLLDHEVIELCASLPTHLKVHRGTGKYLLKKLAERYLPRDLLYRRKMGFSIPLGEWLRGPLQEMVRDLLGSRDLMDPLDGEVIQEHVDAFYDRGEDHSSRIWALLMYAKWKEVARAAAD